MSDSLRPHDMQHARLPCLSLSPSPRACSNSCLLSRSCHPSILSSVIPFSSCLQSFPASGSFPMIPLFSTGGHSVEASASASVLPMNIQGWFPLGLAGLISLQSKGLSRIFSSSKAQKHQFFNTQPSLWSNSHIHTWPYRKNHSLTRQTFVGKVMSLLFNTLSRFVIVFLSKSKCLLILWLQSLYTVILEPKKIKSVTVSIVSPYICHEVMALDPMILVFWMLSFKPTFSLSSFTFSGGSLVPLHFLPVRVVSVRVVSSTYLRLLIFLPAVLIPACASSSPAFCLTYSACRLNKQGDNIQPWRTPFPIVNQSIFPCPFLPIA